MIEKPEVGGSDIVTTPPFIPAYSVQGGFGSTIHLVRMTDSDFDIFSTSRMWGSKLLDVANNPMWSTAADGDDGLNTLTLAFRMAELSAFASEEGIDISDASRRDLQRFIGTHPGTRRPSLFLLDSGNFRTVWRNERDEQLALQFLGDHKIQYVIFRKSEDAPGGIARSWGLDSFRGIEALIDALGVRRLIGN